MILPDYCFEMVYFKIIGSTFNRHWFKRSQFAHHCLASERNPECSLLPLGPSLGKRRSLFCPHWWRKEIHCTHSLFALRLQVQALLWVFRCFLSRNWKFGADPLLGFRFLDLLLWLIFVGCYYCKSDQSRCLYSGRMSYWWSLWANWLSLVAFSPCLLQPH